MTEKVELLGYAVDRSDVSNIVARGVASLDRGELTYVMACLNPHSYVVAKQDIDFGKALKSADSLIPDGAGIVLAGRVIGRQVTQRVAGFEYFWEFSRQADKRGDARYFFLGSSETVLGLIEKRLRRDFPNITVAGSLSPPMKSEFGFRESERMVKSINNSGANVLWIGMTAPKQEKWLHANRTRLDVKFAGSIGAVFDFYAGTKKRAPDWVCNLGLEWLPRLAREPRRLFRRNFVSTPLFLVDVLRSRFADNGRASGLHE